MLITRVLENELTDEGVQAIADMVKANTTITEFNLFVKLKDSPDARLITYLFCSKFIEQPWTKRSCGYCRGVKGKHNNHKTCPFIDAQPFHAYVITQSLQ